MASRNGEAHRLLAEAGAVVIRKAKHGNLYRLPNGSTILLAGSPGDRRSLNNFVKDLRRALTVETHGKIKEIA